MDILKNNYLFDAHHVRIGINDYNKLMFCAKDVCEAIGIIWKGRRGTLRGTDEKSILEHYHQTPGGVQTLIFVDETTLYRLIFRSDKSRALDFQNWVCGEVLPSLRKTGSYGKALKFNQITKLESPLLPNTLVKMPEISARVYAKINGLSREKINDMCLEKQLPCRKIGPSPKGNARDGRIWWVNLNGVEKDADQQMNNQLELEQG